MEFVIGGVVILLVGSFAVWKLLRKGESSTSAIAAPEGREPAQPRRTLNDAAEVTRQQPAAVAPSRAAAEPPKQAQAPTPPPAKAPEAKAAKASPVAVHVEPLDVPKVAEAVKAPGTQSARTTAPEASASAKVETEDWLGFVPSLTAKTGDDDDTELILEDD